MESDSASVEHLANVLFESKKPITYSSFARDRRIHVNNAKTILHEFYKANIERLQGTFIISGSSADGNTLVKFAKTENSLLEHIKAFKKVNTIHVYLLHLKEISLTTTDIALEDTKHRIALTEIDKYEPLGLIKGPELVIASEKTVPQSAAPKLTEKQPPSTAGKTAKPAVKSEKFSGLTSGYVSRKANAAQPSKAKPAQTKPTYQYKSRKAEKLQPKERVIQSTPEVDPEEKEEEVDEIPRKTPQTDLNQLFMDDFSDEEPPKQDESGDVAMEEVEKHDSAEPSAEPEQQDVEMSSSAETTPAPEPAAEAAATNFDEVDEDGYVVARKNPEPSKPQKQALKVPTKRSVPQKSSGKKAKTQLSLMNFFGK